MNDFQNSKLASDLLAQDKLLEGSEYRRYRDSLEQKLQKNQWWSKLVYRMAYITFIVAFVLMFVGGSKVYGPFDPTEDGANGLSITLGVIYAISAVLFPILTASYYSRFRPATRRLENDLRDLRILEIQREIGELRELVQSLVASQESEG